jgi:hypothetical protein
MVSPDSWVTLTNLANQAGIVPGKPSGTVEELYASEFALLGTQRIIPLFHLPVSYGATNSLKNWSVRADGSWNVSDAWLGITNHDR